jgi:tRNA pseudouridine55 synthase
VAIDGIMLIDKDEGMTSFEVVRKIRARLHMQKAGHTGTLDKAASGLLIVCVNRASAVQSIFMDYHKLYRAIISFGRETDTLDSHGRVVREEKVEQYSDARIRDVLERYTGKIYQTPPAFSAIHHDGERLYKKALRGDVPHIAPREVEIKTLTLLNNEMGQITIEVFASKGTYIRSLARDIANSLGTCGHLAMLRRLEIGPFSVKEAFSLSDIADWSPVIPLDRALKYLPRIMVNQKEAKMILNGIPPARVFDVRKMSVHKSTMQNGPFSQFAQDYCRVLCGKRLIAIIEKGKILKYFKVFRNYEVAHN